MDMEDSREHFFSLLPKLRVKFAAFQIDWRRYQRTGTRKGEKVWEGEEEVHNEMRWFNHFDAFHNPDRIFVNAFKCMCEDVRGCSPPFPSKPAFTINYVGSANVPEYEHMDSRVQNGWQRNQEQGVDSYSRCSSQSQLFAVQMGSLTAIFFRKRNRKYVGTLRLSMVYQYVSLQKSFLNFVRIVSLDIASSWCEMR